jgi:hypothetical protein
VRDEGAAAGAEARPQTRPEAVAELAVDAERLPREQAVEPDRPLLAHTAGLETVGAGSDSGPVDDQDRAAALGQVVGDREPDHAGSDHGDVRGSGSRSLPDDATIAPMVRASLVPFFGASSGERR